LYRLVLACCVFTCSCASQTDKIILQAKRLSTTFKCFCHGGIILRGFFAFAFCYCEKDSMIGNLQRGLKIFTWHIHGSYLFYLSQGDYTIYIPVSAEKKEGYYGRGRTFPFGSNVIELPVAEVKNATFDCILFQTNKNFFHDQFEILSGEQRCLPRVYVEHDPPWKDPVDTLHPVTDQDVLMVHVTPFNKLMWHNLNKLVHVVDHGIVPPAAEYSGELAKGIVVINHLHQRGRKLGADIYDCLSAKIPMDLAGMGTAPYGGLGEVLHQSLPAFISRYRFFFNPIRYTSLGLAVLEAMMIGMPVIALATTEYSTVIRDGYNGFIHTDPEYLADKMHLLLADHTLAMEISRNAKKSVQKRFNIERFTTQWKNIFLAAINHKKNQYETTDSIYK
jgi:hypothetical protein